jgi:hypothetical protein
MMEEEIQLLKIAEVEVRVDAIEADLDLLYFVLNLN